MTINRELTSFIAKLLRILEVKKKLIMKLGIHSSGKMSR